MSRKKIKPNANQGNKKANHDKAVWYKRLVSYTKKLINKWVTGKKTFKFTFINVSIEGKAIWGIAVILLILTINPSLVGYLPWILDLLNAAMA